MERVFTRRQLVARVLSDGQWHDTVEFTSRYTGGAEGTRRLREIRRLVGTASFESRRKAGSNQWQYRVLPSGLGIVQGLAG